MIHHTAPIFYTTIKPMHDDTGTIYMRTLIKHKTPTEAAMAIWDLFTEKQKKEKVPLGDLHGYKITTEKVSFSNHTGYCKYDDALHFAVSSLGEVFLGKW